MRAKFTCQSVTDNGNNYTSVKLTAVYAGDKNAEDNQFAAATPSGNIEMAITNPAAIGYFKPQKNYYLDFSEAN